MPFLHVPVRGAWLHLPTATHQAFPAEESSEIPPCAGFVNHAGGNSVPKGTLSHGLAPDGTQTHSGLSPLPHTHNLCSGAALVYSPGKGRVHYFRVGSALFSLSKAGTGEHTGTQAASRNPKIGTRSLTCSQVST